MPSHIFRRIGRYADASKSNQDAIAADRYDGERKWADIAKGVTIVGMLLLSLS